MKIKIKTITKKVLLVFLGLNALLIILSFFVNVDKSALNEDNLFPSSISLLNLDSSRNYQKIEIETLVSPLNLSDDEQYGKKAYRWDTGNSIDFIVDIKDTDIYELAVDYKSLQTDVQNISINLKIDETENNNIVLPTYWTDSTHEHTYDIYQNEVTQMQITYNVWQKYFLYDNRFYEKTPLSFNLTKGIHMISITKNVGDVLLGDIYFVKKDQFDAYDSSLNTKTSTSQNEMIILEGENPLYKSSPEIRASSVGYSHLTPFSTSKNMINTLSGDSFNTSGDTVTYAFNIEKAGYYGIDLKYYILQTNTTVYSDILIDNVILNEQLNCYPFKNTSNGFINETLNDGSETMQFYFDVGQHTLTLRLNAGFTSPIYYELISLIEEINALYLEVVKLTGGNTDKNKGWDMEKHIPDINDRFSNWITRLDNLKELIENVSKSNANKQNRLYQQIDNAYDKLVSLAKKPNQLPYKLNILSKGSSSAALMLSNSLHASTFNPLSIDKIYIFGESQKVPKINKNFFVNYLATVQRIFRTSVEEVEDNTVNIWVNRSTYYVSMMQQFADAYYTPTSKNKIRFSLLPDESKLIYANASNTQPDAALGISSGVPYTLGIRGALADMHQMSDFNETIKVFAPGSLLNLCEGDKIYGLPETQDFQVTFYRKDLLISLGLEVPETYDDIINILPTLQRYGMNYYMPMAGGSGLKALTITAPFIYQYGGELYTDDYLGTAIDSKESIEAINMMVDLFAIYSLPLTTQNFYDSFRNGLSPVGIAGFDTYLQFINAAPEIAGKWSLALAPGVLQEDGTINRMQTGDTRTTIIFEKSNKKEEAWDFIKWWLSTPVQEQFANDIEATYGPTFLWNTANIEAFKKLALPEEDKAVILKQWEYLFSIPQTPATYMVERGVSNIWNSAVFNSSSVRASVTDYTIEIDREIIRKMVEFKYIDENGNVLKPYSIPSIEDIEKWQEE